MAKRRRMTAKQRKYFGKRRTRKVYAARVHKRRYVSMARRGRRSYSRGGGRSFGGMKGMIAPVIGGVADNVLDNFIPQAPGIGGVAVGIFMKNNVVRDLGLYKLGYGIANFIPLPGMGNNSRSGGNFT